MKVFLWILGGAVGLILLYLLLRPTTPAPVVVQNAGGGGWWSNVGRLLGSAIGTAAGSYAATPKAPQYGTPGYGPGNIAWQPSQGQLASSYNSVAPGSTIYRSVYPEISGEEYMADINAARDAALNP